MMRLLEDKASLVGEMNAMNEVVEKLTATNAALQRDLHEARQGGGGGAMQSTSSAAAAAAAALPSTNRLGAGGIARGGDRKSVV